MALAGSYSTTTRDQLRREIEDTRTAFHQLLASIPVDAYRLPTDNPAWNVGQVLYHMSLAPRLLGGDAKMIRGQSRLLRLVPAVVPRRLFDWLNKEWTRTRARNPSPAFLAGEYDKAHAAALRALAETDDADFQLRVHYPDWDPLLSGDVTLERLFHYVKAHFDSHAGQLRQTVTGQQDSRSSSDGKAQ
ncbi:MAG: DinB family protein [Caldilineales bacterium]